MSDTPRTVAVLEALMEEIKPIHRDPQASFDLALRRLTEHAQSLERCIAEVTHHREEWKDMFAIESEKRLALVEYAERAVHMLRLVLPLAIGYAHAHPHKSNEAYVAEAREFLEIFTNGPAQAVASSGEAIREGRGNPSGGTEKPSCVYRSGCVAGLGCELEGRCLAPEIERKHGVGPHAEHAPSMVPVFRVEEGCSDLWCVTFDGIAAPYLWSFKDEQTAKNLARELNRLVAPTMKLSSQNPVRPDLSEAGGADRDRTR